MKLVGSSLIVGGLVCGLSITQADRAEALGTGHSSSCLDGAAINDAISKRGLAAVFRELFSTDDGAERLLKCIRTGDEAWLRIALQIGRGRDGGGPQEMSAALGDALELNPAGVLSLLVTGPFIMSEVCGCEGNVDLLGLTYDRALATLGRRRKAVEALESTHLTGAKQACLEALGHREAWIKEHKHDVYGVR